METKYFNLAYLINHLTFGDTITLESGKSYSVEQVHDRYLLDAYDDKYELHTFDLRRLYLNEKLHSVNDFCLPKFDINPLLKAEFSDDESKINEAVSGSEFLWLPISFDDLLLAIKNDRIYSKLYASKIEEELDEISWAKLHFEKLFLNPKNKQYLDLLNECGDRVAIIGITKDIIEDYQTLLSKEKELLIFKSIELDYIDKIYFLSQNALDKFLGEARLMTTDIKATSKCIFDPYILDEDLEGKW